MSPVSDEDGGIGRQRPIRPRYRPAEPERPATRPGSVWVVSLLLVTIGVLGVVVGALLLADAIDHGEEDEIVAAAVFSMLLAAAQVVGGIGIFVGWGRGRVIAMLVSALLIVLVIVAAATDRMGSGQAWLTIALNGALLFGMAGPKISDWCR